MRARTSLPAPEIFAYDVTADDPLGYAYLLMEALPERVLHNRMAWTIPDDCKKKVASQFARHIYELSTLRFRRIGRVVFSQLKLWRDAQSIESNAGELAPVDLLPFAMEGSKPVGPLSTSLQYFYLLRWGQTKAVRQSHAGEVDWEAATWFLEKSVTSMITEEHINGPFPLCHLDIHLNNMLFHYCRYFPTWPNVCLDS